MGHLGHLKEEYRALAERLGSGSVAFPEPADPRAREGWKEILEILYTPEEAALAARLPVLPISLRKLSARLEVPEAELRARLDPMCDKGIVMDLVHPRSGEVAYLLSPPLVGFFEFSLMRAVDSIPKKRMAEALHAYAYGDDTFAREAFGKETVVGRAMVNEEALAAEAPDVLDWERASALVEEAKVRSVSLCLCRHKAEHLGARCAAPMENCLSLNAGAEFVIRRGFGRSVEKQEALEILAAAREGGLVQIADNVVRRPTFICNCCGCCCGQLHAVSRFDLAAVNPSGFQPRTAEALCSGCSRCARACPVGAVEMKPRRADGKRKTELHPAFDLERCIGCGVCAGACRKGATRMERGERPRVPSNAVEKSIRMALERGRLADLLFDAGAGRGSRFLHAAVTAIAKLPIADRILASEQVRSRFVRAAVERF